MQKLCGNSIVSNVFYFYYKSLIFSRTKIDKLPEPNLHENSDDLKSRSLNQIYLIDVKIEKKEDNEK